MKPRRLFGIALLFPYLFWGISLLIANEFASLDLPDFWNFLLIPIMFYAVGALFWFIPYTLLAIGLWIWSRNKSVISLRKAGLLAPIYLSILVTIGYLIYSWISYLPKNGETVVYVEPGTAILGAVALLVGSSLLFGYLFVGIGLTFYNLLISKSLIAEDVMILSGLALLIAVLATISLINDTVYEETGGSCTVVCDVNDNCTESCETTQIRVTLIEENGPGVMILPITATLVSGVPLFLALRKSALQRLLTWISALFLLTYSISASFSIGYIFIPSAILILIVAIITLFIRNETITEKIKPE